jgi:hypothetical protein
MSLYKVLIGKGKVGRPKCMKVGSVAQVETAASACLDFGAAPMHGIVALRQVG